MQTQIKKEIDPVTSTRHNSQWINDLHWVRDSQQTRSQRTQAALLGAAAELFAEQGVEATSVADVAARANCSVGAVYHHFRDKQTMQHALLEKYIREFHATIAEATNPERWDGATLGDMLQAFLVFGLDETEKSAALKRACYGAARTNPEMTEALRGTKKEMYREVTRLFQSRKDEIGHPEPDLALGYVVDQMDAMLRLRRFEDDYTALERRSDSVFIRESLNSVCAYLQISNPLM